MTTPQQRGREAEEKALHYLQQQGLQLLVRNWRCRGGELDLVMLEKTTVVFVEVRYRQRALWGSALESITPTKQQRLIRAAQQFLQQHPRWAQHPCRFDVVALLPEGHSPPLHWLCNAFTA